MSYTEKDLLAVLADLARARYDKDTCQAAKNLAVGELVRRTDKAKQVITHDETRAHYYWTDLPAEIHTDAVDAEDEGEPEEESSGSFHWLRYTHARRAQRMKYEIMPADLLQRYENILGDQVQIWTRGDEGRGPVFSFDRTPRELARVRAGNKLRGSQTGAIAMWVSALNQAKAAASAAESQARDILLAAATEFGHVEEARLARDKLVTLELDGNFFNIRYIRAKRGRGHFHLVKEDGPEAYDSFVELKPWSVYRDDTPVQTKQVKPGNLWL